MLTLIVYLVHCNGDNYKPLIIQEVNYQRFVVIETLASKVSITTCYKCIKFETKVSNVIHLRLLR